MRRTAGPCLLWVISGNTQPSLCFPLSPIGDIRLTGGMSEKCQYRTGCGNVSITHPKRVEHFAAVTIRPLNPFSTLWVTLQSARCSISAAAPGISLLQLQHAVGASPGLISRRP